MYRVLDRADAQLEVGISGAYVRAPRTGAMEALRSVTRYLLGTRQPVSEESGSDAGGTDELFGQRLGWRPAETSIAEQWPALRRRMPFDVFLEKRMLRGRELWDGRAQRDVCSTPEELLRLKTILGHFSGDSLLRSCGTTGNCAACWSGQGEGVGVEDVVVARGCARSWTIDQIDAIKEEQGRLADEGAGSAKTSCIASGLWYRDSW